MNDIKIEKSKVLSKNTIAFTSNKGHEDHTRWGVLNTDNQNVILEEEYIHVYYDPNSNVYFCGKYIDEELDIEDFLNEDLALYSPYKKVLRFCVFDENFNTLIPYKYTDISIVNCKYFIVRDENWNCGILDFSGNVLIDCLYKEIWCDTEDHFFVFKSKTSSEVGYLDLDGNVCFGYDYSSLRNVSVHSKKGCENTTIFGFDSLPFDVHMYKRNEYTPYHLVVKKGNFYGIIDISGKVLLPFEYDEINEDTNSVLILKKDGIVFRKLFEDLVDKYVDTYLKINTKNNFIPNKTNTYLFFDTETTGVPQNYNAPSTDINNWPRLVQLSWIITDEERDITENNYIIRCDNFDIPIEASNLHGITTQISKELGKPLDQVLDRFLKDLKIADYIVGHNVSFDKKIVGAELIRLGKLDIMDLKHSYCTMESATDYCKIPGYYGYKYPKLQELYFKLFGYNFDYAHNSAVDTEATRKCFWEMRKRGLI